MKIQWFVDALADLKRVREHPEPLDKQKFAWLIEHGKVPAFRTLPLEKQFEGRTHNLKIGHFWSNLLKETTGKAFAERNVLELHAWYQDAVRKFKEKRSKNSLGRVPVAEQIEWLIELGRKPVKGGTVPKSAEGGRAPWNAGQFWRKLQGNWTGATATKLSPEQKARLQECPWMREWIRSAQQYGDRALRGQSAR
jgi:hypothetical protein